MIVHASRRTFASVIAGLLLLVTGCDSYETNVDQAPSRSLSEIRESGRLIVLTRNAPTTRYIGRDGEPTGPEHDLATAFGAWLGVEVEFHNKTSVSAVLDAVEDAEGDLAAAGLTITDPRRDRFRFGPPYQPVTQQVVCRRDNVQPEEVGDLVGLDIRVIADSSYAERLKALQADDHPELAWTTVADTTTEALLRGVWQRKFDCTVADSTIVDINRRYYPELIAPMNLSREQQLGWVMPQPREDLADAVEDWLDEFRNDGRLASLRDQYYGFFAEFDYVDTRTYIRRIDQRFPEYREWFRQAAARHDIPFTVLAAQGYQESHWRADAKSPTGVRGIMMLTQNTAKAVGVTNRLDAKRPGRLQRGPGAHARRADAGARTRPRSAPVARREAGVAAAVESALLQRSEIRLCPRPRAGPLRATHTRVPPRAGKRAGIGRQSLSSVGSRLRRGHPRQVGHARVLSELHQQRGQLATMMGLVVEQVRDEQPCRVRVLLAVAAAGPGE